MGAFIRGCIKKKGVFNQSIPVWVAIEQGLTKGYKGSIIVSLDVNLPWKLFDILTKFETAASYIFKL